MNPYTDEQLHEALRIARHVVHKGRDKIRGLNIEIADIAQEAVISLTTARPWDPKEGTFATYVGRFAQRRLIDAYRKHHRDRTNSAIRDDRAELPPVDLEQSDLPDWLLSIRTRTDRLKRSMKRRTYTLGQEIAVAALAWRCRLTSRETVKFISEREDVRDALGVRFPPSQMAVVRWYRRHYRALNRSVETSATSTIVPDAESILTARTTKQAATASSV